MSLKSVINFEPVRTVAALLAFGSSVVLGLAYGLHWSGEAVGLISSGWSGFVALLGTFFVNSRTTANSDLDHIVHDTIVHLSELKDTTPSPDE